MLNKKFYQIDTRKTAQTAFLFKLLSKNCDIYQIISVPNLSIILTKLMQRKRNKKVIKFQRKPIQESNSLQPVDNDKSRQQDSSKYKNNKRTKKNNEKVEKKSEPLISNSDRQQFLEIPRSWKIDGTIDKIRNRLISIVQQKQPLMSVQSMFDNEQLKIILGKTSESFRDSQVEISKARKKKKIIEKQLIKEERRESALLGVNNYESEYQGYKIFSQPNNYEQKNHHYVSNQFHKNNQKNYRVNVPSPNDNINKIRIPNLSQPTNFLDLLIDSQELDINNESQFQIFGDGEENNQCNNNSIFGHNAQIIIPKQRHNPQNQIIIPPNKQLLQIVMEQTYSKRNGYLPQEI